MPDKTILYKNLNKKKYQERPKKIIDIEIEEKPKRPIYVFKSNKERYRYCCMVKTMVRRTPEYKQLVRFLKKHKGMDCCDVFRNLSNNPEERKHYRIELHHHPFTLLEIINVVVSKRQALGETLNPFLVTEEVLELHYDGKVGLMNLSVTAHELAENGRIFIPLHRIRDQRYLKFVEEYEEYMDPNLIKKIEMLIKMSQKAKDVTSDCLDTEFVYVNIDGFDFPQVPDEWKNALKSVSIEETLKDKEDDKKKEKKSDGGTDRNDGDKIAEKTIED